jgi:undecaprenyl phosphate N,N'-diacetylbacillosamine 1-phosphate transferase
MNCKRMYRLFFKRMIDLCLVIIVLLIFWPIILILLVWLKFSNISGSIFFFQERLGKDGKVFKIIKFKSMNDNKDKSGNLLPDKDRLTKIGRFIRKTSLDELPQLINVLKGNMSLVGPRPLLPEYFPLYDKKQRRRNEVKPGITGWAQVHGRNGLKLSTRFEYDVWYVDHLCLMFDIKILFMTIRNLFFSKVVVCRQDLEGVDDLNFDSRAFPDK